MKLILNILIGLFSTSLYSQSLCSDLNFELIAPGVYTTPTIPNWSIDSQTTAAQTPSICLTPSTWIAGSQEFTIVATPILGIPFIGGLPHSPFGGTVVARINNSVGNISSTRLSRTFSVSPANPFLSYALAFDGEIVQHECCQNTRIEVNFKNSIGAVIPCLSQTIIPYCSSNFSITSNHAWSNWQTYTVNLTTQPSTIVTMEVIARDCNFGGHYMYCYFDAFCSSGGPGYSINTSAGDNLQRVSWCAGTNTAYITAPPGIAGYTWSVPPTASVLPANLNSTLLTVTNPSPNTTFTITTLSYQGCLAATVYTLVYTSVSLNSTSISGACGTQANGGATIQATGSSAGYSVIWYSGGVPVGTGLINNTLTGGNYSVTITSGAAGCGSVATSVFIPAYSQQVGLNSNLFGLCSGQSTVVVLSSNPPLNTGNASFSWSPSAFLSSTNNISAVLTPTATSGSSLALVYTIAVTPTAAPHCIFTSTALLNVSNPIPPVLSVPQGICDNSAPFQVSVTPSYQGFFTASPGNCMSSAGVFSPAISTGTCLFAYTYSYAGCTSVTATDSIFVLSSPNLIISASQNSLCQGQTCTLSVTGAPQYTWSNAVTGPTLVVTPLTSSVISVSGTNSTACTAMASITLSVSPLPTISVVPGQLCLKPQGILTALGADSYAWSNGATGATVQPLVAVGMNTILVTGTISATQCTNSVVHSFMVYNPFITLTGDSLVCAGEEYTLSASGCTSYTWNASFTGPTYTVVSNTAQQVTHIVSGEDNGCNVIDSITIRIDECLGLSESILEKSTLIFPNPSIGIVQVSTSEDAQLLIWDLNGAVLVNRVIHAFIQETIHLQPGSYFAGIHTKSGVRYQFLSVLVP